MEISYKFKEEIINYLKLPRFMEVLEKLGVLQIDIDGIAKYLDTYPVKLYAETRFLQSIKSYMENFELPRNEDGLVNSRDMLKIYEQNIFGGIRGSKKYLGQDGVIYIKKQAEGTKGPIFDSEGKYNPTMANAVFEFLGQKAAEAIPAEEGFPYYYVISRFFLEKNQHLVSVDSEEMDKYLNNTIRQNVGDKTNSTTEYSSITHSQILYAIEQFTRERLKGQTKDKIEKQIKEIKISYAIQETLKEFICSIDQNLGNTSLIITKKNDGEEEITLSPAYDMDLSFNMGYKLLHLHGDKNNNKFYRTTQNGSTTLKDIVEEFSSTVPGYIEKLGEIISKLDSNYVDQILNIAYKNSGAKYFKSESARNNYSSILIRRVAELKHAFQSIKHEKNLQRAY